MNDSYWEQIFYHYIEQECLNHNDASHDLSHFCRVANIAKRIALIESHAADSLILLAASFFHDIVNLPKNHPEAKFSSQYSAAKTKEILANLKFPSEKIGPVCHAIEAHSYSAKIPPQTLEAKIVQDADRMEALGAIGMMRTFYVSGRMNRMLFHPQDPLAKNRPLDDKTYALDHFYCKLFKLGDLLQTTGGKQIAKERTDFLHSFIDQFSLDFKDDSGPTHFIMHACYLGGSEGKSFWHPSDPFATQRPLSPNNFILDCLKERSPACTFMNQFFTQLREECLVESIPNVIQKLAFGQRESSRG